MTEYEGSASVEITVFAGDGDGPTAHFTAAPTLGAPPLEVTFDAVTSTGTGITYTWDFGDGTTLGPGDDVSPTHTYASVGGYTAVLTVTDEDELTDSYAMFIEVEDGEDPDPPDPGDVLVGTCDMQYINGAYLSTPLPTDHTIVWTFENGTLTAHITVVEAIPDGGEGTQTFSAYPVAIDDGISFLDPPESGFECIDAFLDVTPANVEFTGTEPSIVMGDVIGFTYDGAVAAGSTIQVSFDVGTETCPLLLGICIADGAMNSQVTAYILSDCETPDCPDGTFRQNVAAVGGSVEPGDDIVLAVYGALPAGTPVRARLTLTAPCEAPTAPVVRIVGRDGGGAIVGTVVTATVTDLGGGAFQVVASGTVAGSYASVALVADMGGCEDCEPSPYAPVVLADDPVAYWPLTGDTPDQDLVADFDLQWLGVAPTPEQILPNDEGGVAVTTDVDVGRHPVAPTTSAAFVDVRTVEAWVQFTSTEDVAIASYRNTANHWAVYHLPILGIRLNVPYSGGLLSQAIDTGVEVNDGDLHHILISWGASADTYELWVDGALAAAGPLGVTLADSGTADYVTIGSETGPPGRPFDGLIGHVALYEARLTESHAVAHNAAGRTGGC